MKVDHISILLYGRDAHLLELRKWFLHSLGYRVYTAMTLAEFSAIPASPQISLITLCHTLSERECPAVIASASARWPEIKSLTLPRDVLRSASAVRDKTMHPIDAPTHLLTRVGELVGYAGSSSYSHTY